MPRVWGLVLKTGKGQQSGKAVVGHQSGRSVPSTLQEQKLPIFPAKIPSFISVNAKNVIGKYVGTEHPPLMLWR